jgi:hypothetical protein
MSRADQASIPPLSPAAPAFVRYRSPEAGRAGPPKPRNAAAGLPSRHIHPRPSASIRVQPLDMSRRQTLKPRMLMLIVLAICLAACARLPQTAPTSIPQPVPTALPDLRGPLPETQPMPPGVFEVPPGKALFVVRNFTRLPWNVSLGKITLAVPPFPPGKGYSMAQLEIDPGEYTWQVSSTELGEGYFVSDEEGYTIHRFAVQAGQAYFVRLLSLSPGQHSLRYVVEAVLFSIP